jgi:hypothetical protein
MDMLFAKGCSEYNILEMNRAYLTCKLNLISLLQGAIWDTLVLTNNFNQEFGDESLTSNSNFICTIPVLIRNTLMSES